jgi:predicted short-subunit dehydrogenase-like oxidoreductase (DUF2520 family)
VTRPTTVAVIGAGRVGTAVALLLQRAGYRIVAATGGERSRERVRRYLPSTPFLAPSDAADPTRHAAVVLLSVPDDVIEQVCRDLASKGAFGPGQTVVHLSGALGLDALRAAEERGALTLSLHPLQAFPEVDEGVSRLPGSAIAVTAMTDEGALAGEELARALGAAPFRLEDEAKPLYHAAAVFCSNYLVAVEAVAERLFRLAGLEHPVEWFAPLARSALDVTLHKGPRAALTGPAARGDARTVERHVRALAARSPEDVEPYVALARVAARLASSGGSLSEEGRLRLEEVLERWR